MRNSSKIYTYIKEEEERKKERKKERKCTGVYKT